MMHKMIFSGFGGQGVMMMGKVIAQAGMIEDKNVTWLPSYGPEMRGGTANCTVIVSDKPIGAPVTEVTTEVVAMNIPSVAKFEESLEKDGTLFINTSMGKSEPTRKDINVVHIASNDLADKVGNLRTANIVTVGAFAAKTGIVKKDTLYKVIEQVFGKKGEKIVEVNKKAIDEGYKFIEENK